jgi:adenylate cyclase class 2
MSASGQEIEVKFYLHDQAALQHKLEQLGASLVQARVHEVNLRFDTPDRRLGKASEVLRLRQDAQARLTFKGQGREQAGARLRQELEFSVSDFDTAWQVLLALGFEPYMMYEKYRATYQLGEVLVTLDEMPFGEFAELEGPDGETIRRTAGQLGLDWAARSLESYTALFDRVKRALGLDFADLSFANFEGVRVSEVDLGIKTADSRLRNSAL